MNVTVNSQLLAGELRLLNKVVPTKPAIAILSHALLRADDALHLYATDLEVGVTTGCPCRVDEAGEATVPVAKFLQMVEQLPDDDVSLATDKRHLVVRCGAFTSRLQTLPVEDFPDPPKPEGMTTTIDAASLRGIIDKTRHAITSDGSKYVLKGALLTLAGQAAAMVGTDGKRLALATAGRQAGADASIVVPMKTLDVLAGQASGGEVTVTVGSRHLFFASASGSLLTSRKLEGTFPNYQKIIPRDNDKKVVVDRNALAAALRRVVLAAEETGAVYFDVTSMGMLGLSARSAGIGQAEEGVVISYDGPPLKVCMTGSYVLDFLNASLEPTVELAFKDPNTAVLLTSGVDHVGVIMPMRT